MANVEKVSAALTPEMVAAMRQAVETGEYASSSEVLREAMRDWQLRRAQRLQALDELGRLWDQGIASGPAVDGEAAFERIGARLKAKVAGSNA
jgi:antitoxin ParD1/3/4